MIIKEVSIMGKFTKRRIQVKRRNIEKDGGD